VTNENREAALADHSLSAILRRLGRQAAADGPGAIPDAELLRRFADQRDPAAFELIVWRHGATVWGACRRSLSCHHDAEDAFQAVFLVLARKAVSVRQGDCLGAWLHRVAVRVAKRSLVRAAKVGAREQTLVEAAEPRSVPGNGDWSDLGPAVDEEIDRLPAKYRAAFVLCHLQGHTCDEAACRLGCPRGTILSRLARARDRLKDRLTRRGITLSAAGFASLAGGLTAAAAQAASATLAALHYGTKLAAESVSAPAADLSSEVLQAMFLSKLKLACCALLAVLGVGAVGWRELSPDPVNEQFAVVFAADKEPAPVKAPTDLDKLQGAWKFVYAISGGRNDDDEMRFIFEKGTLKLEKISNNGGVKTARVTDEWKFKIDPSAKPKTIDIDKGRVMPGIYELDGDKLKICIREKGDERPAKFEVEKDSQVLLIGLVRERKEPIKKNPVKNEALYVEFRDAPWSKVIEWYSGISGLAYVSNDKPPTGTFKFAPPVVNGKVKQYTLDEITDILNEALKKKGLVLVRREESFTIMTEEDFKREKKTPLEELAAALERARAAEQEALAQRDRAEKLRLQSEESRRAAEQALRDAEQARSVAEQERRKSEQALDELRKQLDETRRLLEKLKKEKKQ
jgi:RNA polymerase sigma factor (sigma-70 family)